MKRILNLNEPAPKILAGAGLFLFVIPGFLYLLVLVLEKFQVQGSLIPVLIKISLGVGAFILAIFVLLVIAE